jgi:hypothetical protein
MQEKIKSTKPNEKTSFLYNVEKSFNDLGLDIESIVSGSDEYTAVKDVFLFGKKRQNIFDVEMRFASHIGCSYNLSDSDGQIYDLNSRIKAHIEDKKGNKKYKRVFIKLNDWINETDYRGDNWLNRKLEILENRFGIKVEGEKKEVQRKTEEVKTEKRFNLREFLKNKISLK